MQIKIVSAKFSNLKFKHFSFSLCTFQPHRYIVALCNEQLLVDSSHVNSYDLRSAGISNCVPSMKTL